MNLTEELTRFPREGIYSPKPARTLWAADFQPAEGQRPFAVQLNRWFCCQCAEGGFDDKIGIANSEDMPYVAAECPEEGCAHAKCHNCGLSPDTSKMHIIRTFGGLHVSPKFIDPVNWECLCGEWRLNRFDARCELDKTQCAGENCWATREQLGNLHRGSVVLNRYGQRLGTADQSVMLAGGPWDLQRRALGDSQCALLDSMRPTPFRPPKTQPTMEVEIWHEGEAAPKYPPRPPPPELAVGNAALHVAYEQSYLQGIARQARDKGKGLAGFAETDITVT